MGGTISKPPTRVPIQIYNKEWCDKPLDVGDPIMRKNIETYVYPVSCPTNPSIVRKLTLRDLKKYQNDPDKDIFTQIGKASTGLSRRIGSYVPKATRRTGTGVKFGVQNIRNTFKKAMGIGFNDPALQILLKEYAALKVKKTKIDKSGGNSSSVDSKINAKKTQIRLHIKGLKLSAKDQQKLMEVLNKVYTEDDETLEASLNTNNSNSSVESGIQEVTKILKEAAADVDKVFVSSSANVETARVAPLNPFGPAAVLGPAHPASLPAAPNPTLVSRGRSALGPTPAKIAYAKQLATSKVSTITKNNFQYIPDVLRTVFPKCVGTDSSKPVCKENTSARIVWDIAMQLFKGINIESSSIAKLEATYNSAKENQKMLESDLKKLQDEEKKVNKDLNDLNIKLREANEDKDEADKEFAAAKAAPAAAAAALRPAIRGIRFADNAVPDRVSQSEITRARDAATKAKTQVRTLTKAVADATAIKDTTQTAIVALQATIDNATANTNAALAALNAAKEAARAPVGTEEYREAAEAAEQASRDAVAAAERSAALTAAYKAKAVAAASAIGTGLKYGIGAPIALGVLATGAAVVGTGAVVAGTGLGLYQGAKGIYSGARSKDAANTQARTNERSAEINKTYLGSAARGTRKLGRGIGRGLRTAGVAIGTGAAAAPSATAAGLATAGRATATGLGAAGRAAYRGLNAIRNAAQRHTNTLTPEERREHERLWRENPADAERWGIPRPAEPAPQIPATQRRLLRFNPFARIQPRRNPQGQENFQPVVPRGRRAAVANAGNMVLEDVEGGSRRLRPAKHNGIKYNKTRSKRKI